MIISTLTLVGCKDADNSLTSNTGDSYSSSATVEAATQENASLNWSVITKDGVNEEQLWKEIDIATLETIATEFQTLLQEEYEAERKNPEIVLTEGWIRVFNSERYQKVLDLGDKAMKPLYWIIYKSQNAGIYEYLCAKALYDLSGYDFTQEDGTLTWTNSKEFLERFNERIIK
jgi:hypothetical protein